MQMAANNRGGMRPNGAGKTPSFIVIGLMVVIAILGFNYWNVSSKNSVLVSELSEMSEHMRLSSVKKLSVEKRNDALLQKVRENEQELDKQKTLAQRKEDELNNLNSQMDTKKSECDTQQQELNRVRQEYDVCNSNSQDLETKLDQASEAKSNCEVKLATDKEECEKRVQASATNQDCTEKVKTSQQALLNIIHKLWGNKAIIVLQDAGIDVSGIQLNTDGGGQLPTGGRDQKIAEGQQQPAQQQQQQPAQQQLNTNNTPGQQQQGQGQYPAQGDSQGQGQYPPQGQGQYPQDPALNQQQQGAYPAVNQQGAYPDAVKQGALPAANQQDAYPAVNQQEANLAANQQGAYQAQDGLQGAQAAGVQQQDQQQSWQQHQQDNQQAMGQQPVDGSPGQVGQVQAPVDRSTYNQQGEDQGQLQPAGTPAVGQQGVVQADQGQLGVQPAGADGGAGGPDAPADRQQVQAPESRNMPALPDQHQAPQGQEGALQPPPQDGAAAGRAPPGGVDSNAANEQDSRRRGDGNLQFRPNDQGEIRADDRRIDDAVEGRRFGQI